jgi:predicted Zn-dependent peptidase
VRTACTRAPTSPSGTDMLSALRHLAEERAAERETAPSYVRAALRARVFPNDLPAAGTDEAAARLESADLAALWGRMYAPGRVSVVAVGDVQADAVRRAFRSLPGGGAAGDGEAGIDTVPSLAADTPQATRGWVARAYPAPDADPAALSVAARLLRANLRRRMTRSAVEVEHWWTHHGQALALVVATPDSLMPAARRTVGGALEAVGADVSPQSVADAARAVRRDMLFYSRTPERMAEIVGGFADRGDDPEAAQRYFARLEEVTEDEVRAVLELLAAQEPVVVEVPAQRIRRENRR